MAPTKPGMEAPMESFMGLLCCRKRKLVDDPEARKKKYAGLSPEEQLHAAACESDVRKLEELHKQGVDLYNRRDEDGLFALDECAWSGNDLGMACLLQLGYDPTQSMQAVVGCASFGLTDVLEVMLEGGAQVDQEFGNFSALRWSVEMPYADCAKALIKHGAWKLEADQDTILRRLKGMRTDDARDALAEIAKIDPARAKDCVMPPWYLACQVL